MPRTNSIKSQDIYLPESECGFDFTQLIGPDDVVVIIVNKKETIRESLSDIPNIKPMPIGDVIQTCWACSAPNRDLLFRSVIHLHFKFIKKKGNKWHFEKIPVHQIP
jgi:hypothetical protein